MSDNYNFALRVAMNVSNADSERAINAQIATALATQRVAEALEENNRLLKQSLAKQNWDDGDPMGEAH